MEEVRIPDATDPDLAGCSAFVEGAPLAMGLTLGPAHTLHCQSPALARLLDAPPAALLGRPAADIVSPSAAAAVVALLDRIFSSGVPEIAAELQHTDPRRGAVYWTYAVWPVRIGGPDPVGLVLQISDTTAQALARRAGEQASVDLVAANERLIVAGLQEQEARADAEAALAVRDQFLSIASHELKTPLTSLIGYTHLLQQGALKEVGANGRAQRMLATIERQANRLNSLIEQLLDLTRLEQGQFNIDRQPLDLAAIVARVVDDVRLTLTHHTITLTAPDEPVRLLGDALRLEQVVQNLISNAVKYSPEGGPVVVRLTTHGAEALLEVADQGIGIPAEACERLFTPFYRAPNAAQNASGFGVGLYVVREIVARHGGRITAGGTEGQGAVFRVSLPLHLAER